MSAQCTEGGGPFDRMLLPRVTIALHYVSMVRETACSVEELAIPCTVAAKVTCCAHGRHTINWLASREQRRKEAKALQVTTLLESVQRTVQCVRPAPVPQTQQQTEQVRNAHVVAKHVAARDHHS